MKASTIFPCPAKLEQMHPARFISFFVEVWSAGKSFVTAKIAMMLPAFRLTTVENKKIAPCR
jgi:hypothetical protein